MGEIRNCTFVMAWSFLSFQMQHSILWYFIDSGGKCSSCHKNQPNASVRFWVKTLAMEMLGCLDIFLTFEMQNSPRQYLVDCSGKCRGCPGISHHKTHDTASLQFFKWKGGSQNWWVHGHKQYFLIVMPAKLTSLIIHWLQGKWRCCVNSRAKKI